MFGSAWRQRTWQRLRADYQLSILTWFSVSGVFGIGPFAIFRFAHGNFGAGLLDLGIITGICIAVAHAWRSGDYVRSGIFLAAVNTIGCLASASILGAPGLFWMYPALLGNFLLLDRGPAVAVTAVALLVLTVQGTAYDSPGQLAMFLVSAAVSSLVAFVFASRTEGQRRELQALATVDSLTGMPNRRAMAAELQIAVEQYRREQRTFGLAMLDLDHFKRINDQHGHEAGDDVLVEFAELVRRSTRKVDRCFRFGGEEFVLLMPAIDHAGLAAIDASLRGRVAAELLCHGRPVTVSIGAAALGPDEDWQAWLARADAALYRAKNEGRNRTVIDGQEAVGNLAQVAASS